jgi:cyanamide hydratase family protein with HD domain
MTRYAYALALAVAALTAATDGSAEEPATTVIAGITIPATPLSRKAESYVRSQEPDFLFNHSVRTYLFGALSLKARGLNYDPETAYVAALFHDWGLVPGHASTRFSFEIDGANKAEEFVKANGGTPEQARTVWNAIVMHDMGRPYQAHQSNEALLLGAGAGGDVVGIDPKVIPSATVEQVLRAYPRLQFKKRFTAAAIDHCRRKPTSQIGWLAPLCLKVAPNADRGSVEDEIAGSPFTE